FLFFFFQAEDGIRDFHVTGVQTCALPISVRWYGHRRSERAQRAAGTERPVEATAGGRGAGERRSAGDREGKILGPAVKRRAVDKIGRARVGKECRCRWSRDQSRETRAQSE